MPLTTPYICRLTLFLAVLVYMNSKQSYSSNKSQEKKFASMGKRFFYKNSPFGKQEIVNATSLGILFKAFIA